MENHRAESLTDVSGSCGKSVFWSYDTDALCITVSGKGKMEDWTDASKPPWCFYIKDIRKVVVEEGVASVGSYAFSACEKLTDILLADTVEQLGIFSFSSCASLTTVVIPEGVCLIGAKAFLDCSALAVLYLPSTLSHIDLRAFDGDAALSIVEYGGSRVDWERIRISMAASGNKYLVQADIRCRKKLPNVSLLYDDVEETDRFVSSLQYLTDYGYCGIFGTHFDAEASADMDFVFDILFRKAGTEGMYASAVDWAMGMGLACEGTGGNRLRPADLAVILYRMGQKNGIPAEAAGKTGGCTEREAALEWCRVSGYLNSFCCGKGTNPEDKSLTRGETAEVLAAYLASDASSTNRYHQILAAVRAAVKQGGDGKLYIIAPRLWMPDIKAKSGDCTLILFPDGQTMMIDAGYTACSGRIVSLLEDLELTHLDYFILSHTHIDHIGGAMAVAKYCYSHAGGYIGCYERAAYVSGTVEPEFLAYLQEKGVKIVTDVTAGTRWEIGGVAVDVLNPGPEYSQPCCGEEVNNLSILMKFTYGASSYLTGGDLFCSRETELAASCGTALRSDVMKANHHGTYTSNSEVWLETVSPMVVLAHADDIGWTPLTERLADKNIVYYSTAFDGLLMVCMGDDRNYTVISQYDSELR